MNLTTFEDYQAQYATSLPIKLREGLTCLQTNVHYAVSVIDATFQTPECVLRIIQLSVALLSLFPSISPSLAIPKQFCKDAKNFTNCIKGLKAIDGFLNFKFAWKCIILNVSGMTLFIVSTLSLIERAQVVDVAAIKAYFIAIPVFGVLPYGGLLPFSIVGLMGIAALLALEKRSKLVEEEIRIKNKKIVSWSQPLDLQTVQIREKNYQTQVSNLQKESDAYQKLINTGKKIQSELDQCKDQTKKIYTCCKALKALNSIYQKKQTELMKYEKKYSEWKTLKENWNHINQQDLEVFRKAKQDKWKIKLNKIQAEKRSNLLSIANNIIILSRQALVIMSVATGYGIVVLPLSINIGLDAVVAGCGIANFLIKRSIKEIKIPPVNLITQKIF
jgi:hypothetical protein